jgi:hypothetical protein
MKNATAIYHFALRNRGETIDDFGGVEMTSDADAIAFGKRVIRELLEKNPEQYALWAMKITKGTRLVRSISLQ